MPRFINVLQTNKYKPDDGKDGDNSVKQSKQIPDHRGIAGGERVQHHIAEDSDQCLSGEVLCIGCSRDYVIVSDTCACRGNRDKQPCTKRTNEIFHGNSG
ncbi:Uncharacterised protein [Enterobacter hormaechei]|nr:Uncharacterised protein [Enterobacter hormaechei]